MWGRKMATNIEDAKLNEKKEHGKLRNHTE